MTTTTTTATTIPMTAITPQEAPAAIPIESGDLLDLSD